MCVQPSLVIDAARHLISVLWDGPPPSDGEIAAALDQLMAAYHQMSSGAVSDSDVEPPMRGGDELYQQVAERFPDYGLYPTVDPLAGVDQPVMMGDAIDDIADITKDMREALWYFENLGEADAHWCLGLLYFHWGRHVRELALYLHAREFG